VFEISKSIVLYYSLEQETKTLAEIISDSTGFEIKELILEEPTSINDQQTYHWKGKKYNVSKNPKIEDLEISFNDYDLIFIGSPVWELTYSPAIKSLFENNEIRNKKIAVFFTHEGEKGNFLSEFKELIGENELVGYIDFYDPLNSNLDSIEEEISKWAKGIKEK